MDALDDLAKARDYLAGGHPHRALRKGWDAAESALRAGDEQAIAQVAEFAGLLSSVSSGRDAEEARRLADYCRYSVTSTGVESHSILSRLGRIGRPQRKCPDCAEKVPREARVCRYCGYRFEPATGGDSPYAAN